MDDEAASTARRATRALLWRVKDERLFLPTVLPVAAVWGQGGKVGGSIPTVTQ